MRFYWTILIAVLMLSAFAAPVFAHNGMEDVGSTLQQIGRGGAFIATDPEIGDLNGNPAGIAMLQEPMFYIDFRGLFPDLGYEGALNASSQSEGYPIPNFGYAAPIMPGMSWGIGLYSVGGMGASARQSPARSPRACSCSASNAGSASGPGRAQTSPARVRVALTESAGLQAG